MPKTATHLSAPRLGTNSRMTVDVLCSDPRHLINTHLIKWRDESVENYDIRVLGSAAELTGGDFLFLVSATEIISATTRSRYRYCLVLHESAVPSGRGWSPLTWQILEGKNEIPITLMEAVDRVDSGPIWDSRSVTLAGSELYEEIIEKVAEVKIAMIAYAIQNFASIRPVKQSDDDASYYPRRRPADSRLDPYRSIAEQFDLLRVADPQRFPAFFDLRGCRYEIHLRKVSATDSQ